jgi:uncharacterized repeat protein (TIGR01451 family)
LSLAPHISARGNFGQSSLEEMDFEFDALLALDMQLRATALAPGEYSTNGIPLGSARKLLAIRTVGPVPVWAEGQLDFALGFESSWQSPGTITAGFNVTNILGLGAMLRSGVWMPSAHRTFRVYVPTAAWQPNLTAQVRAYVDVTLRLLLESLPGPSLHLQSSLAANGTASAPPGLEGFDLLLYDALDSTLALAAPGWDRSAPSVPVAPLLTDRLPILHTSQFRPVGPVIQPAPNMVWIPAGRFAMGRNAAPALGSPCDCPLTDVTLRQGFFIGRFEVTQREFLAVMGSNPSAFNGGIWGVNLERPVESVSWHDATNYCARLTNRERQAGRLPTNYLYRLPTEAEWEYACRAGTTTSFHYGNALRPGLANYECALDPVPCAGNPVDALGFTDQPMPIGRFAPNLWGLHDMHGNVNEWCWDWLGDQLPGGAALNPLGPTNTATRAYRGGSYRDDSAESRSTQRTPLAPSSLRPYLGFRVVLAKLQHAITVTLPTNGTILPPGPAIAADVGSDVTFTATPNPGYVVDQWRVDGVTAATNTQSYALTNIQADHIVHVTFRAVAADLGINAMAAPNPVKVESNLTFTITVQNRGPLEATGVTVSNPLPAGVNFVAASPSQGTCTNDSGAVTCDLGSLAAGSNATVMLLVRPSTAGSITNFVTVRANEPDLAPDDNAFTNVVTVTMEPASEMKIIAASFVSDQFNLTFGTQAGLSYVVQYTDSLSQIVWQDLTVALPGTGDPITVVDPAPRGPMRFYRVCAFSPPP